MRLLEENTASITKSIGPAITGKYGRHRTQYSMTLKTNVFKEGDFVDVLYIRDKLVIKRSGIDSRSPIFISNKNQIHLKLTAEGYEVRKYDIDTIDTDTIEIYLNE